VEGGESVLLFSLLLLVPVCLCIHTYPGANVALMRLRFGVVGLMALGMGFTLEWALLPTCLFGLFYPAPPSTYLMGFVYVGLREQLIGSRSCGLYTQGEKGLWR